MALTLLTQRNRAGLLLFHGEEQKHRCQCRQLGNKLLPAIHLQIKQDHNVTVGLKSTLGQYFSACWSKHWSHQQFADL